MAEKLLPRNVRGQRQAGGEAPSSYHMMGREQKEKKTTTASETVIIKVHLPPSNSQWRTRTKQKESWTPKPVKCCWSICSTSLDRVSLLAAASAVAAGTGQWLELLEGLGLLFSRRWEADVWGSLDSVASHCSWVLLGGWSDRMEQGLFLFSCCGAMAGHPGWQQWKRREGEKGLRRKSSLAQRPKQRGASALHCLSFSVASRKEREACVSAVLILKGSWHLLPPWTWGKTLRICFWSLRS